MTVYNGLPYLGSAIESVLAQTAGEFEFLIIDDHSTDGSVACIRSYADPRIRLVRNDRNLGQAASLNLGLRLARSAYVARADQDDESLPERLERQRRFLDSRSDIAVVGTLRYGMDAAGRRRSRLGRPLGGYGAFVGSLLLGDSPVAHPTVMFRRDAVTAAGGYDPAFAPADDVQLWARLARHRHGAGVIPERLVLYREHARQQSSAQATLQRRHWQRAQQEFVAEFCPPAHVRRLALLLRRDDAVWHECRSKDDVLSMLRALDDTLANARATLSLSPEEHGELVRLVFRRLGPGVRVAPRLSRYPSVLVFAAVFALSPLVAPGVRRTLSRVARQSRRLRERIGVGP